MKSLGGFTRWGQTRTSFSFLVVAEKFPAGHVGVVGCVEFADEISAGAVEGFEDSGVVGVFDGPGHFEGHVEHWDG